MKLKSNLALTLRLENRSRLSAMCKCKKTTQLKTLWTKRIRKLKEKRFSADVFRAVCRFFFLFTSHSTELPDLCQIDKFLKLADWSLLSSADVCHTTKKKRSRLKHRNLCVVISHPEQISHSPLADAEEILELFSISSHTSSLLPAPLRRLWRIPTNVSSLS